MLDSAATVLPLCSQRVCNTCVLGCIIELVADASTGIFAKGVLLLAGTTCVGILASFAHANLGWVSALDNYTD